VHVTEPDPDPLLVLWDVDHTLIDNGGISQRVYGTAFQMLTGREAVHAVATDGRTEPEIVRELFARHGLEFDPPSEGRLHHVLPAALHANVRLLRERGSVLPGAESALLALRGERGIVQSVLTGNVRPNAVTKLATFGLNRYVDFEVGGYGSDDPFRPNLVGIARRRAMTRYGVAFDRRTTILIGDTPRDVQAGLEGGAYVVAVATGSFGMDRLRALGADVTLPDLRDVPAVVDAVLAARTRRS
jgi:phosphoglycolate phosphatase